MRERVRVGVSVGQPEPLNWRIIVDKILGSLYPIQIDTYPFGYDFWFNYYPEKIEDIRQALKSQNIDSTVTVNRSYTKREMLTAEFLFLNFTSVVYSTKRNQLYRAEPQLICPHCGFQEVNWNLQSAEVKGKAEGYKLASLDWHPTVVSRVLADELQKANFTGLMLTTVGSKPSPDWFGLQSNHILPPMQVPPTRLLYSPGRTSLCLPNHRFQLKRSELFYQHEGFVGLDFNHTYELFGDSPGTRMMIISKRVYHLLVNLGIKRLKCEPIRFID
jgi:hypothetical protein